MNRDYAQQKANRLGVPIHVYALSGGGYAYLITRRPYPAPAEVFYPA